MRTECRRSGEVFRRVWRALVAWSVVTVGCGDGQQHVMVSTAHTMDIGLVVLHTGGTATGGPQSHLGVEDP